MSVRTRFAPSPTGSLHVGGVRTALYCLLYAKKNGGTFVLRIEDTDQVRSTEEAAVGIQRDLRWCGIDWDEGPGRDGGCGPYFQSQRLDIYNAWVEKLLQSGRAYRAWETKEELDRLRKEAEAGPRGAARVQARCRGSTSALGRRIASASASASFSRVSG